MPTRELGVRLSADASRFKRGMGAATASLGRFKGMLGAAGGALAVFAGAKGLAGATRAFADFDEAMTESQAIMGDLSQDTMAEMQQAAREVGRTTLQSAEEAGESFYFLASAGLDAKQSIAALPQVAKFAQAGMFDMATATDLATDAQSALGLTVEDAEQNLKNLTRVTDVLVRANQLANASVEQFSEALTNKLGARLRILNKDIEEGTAALAALADQGVKGRKAGRGLNIVFRDLAREAVRSKEAFKELNIEVFDQEGAMRNLADIVEDFENEMGDASARQQAMKMQFLGLNRRAQDYLNMLIGLSDELRDYEEEQRNAGGAAEEVANKQLKTLNRQIELLTSEWEDFKIELGEDLEPIARAEVEGLRGLIAGLRHDLESVEVRPAFFREMRDLGITSEEVREALKDTAFELESMTDREFVRFVQDAGGVGSALHLIEQRLDGTIESGREFNRVFAETRAAMRDFEDFEMPEPPALGEDVVPQFRPPGAEGIEAAPEERISAQERSQRRQQRVTAEMEEALQTARQQRLEEELGLFSRRIDAKQKELRLATEQAIEEGNLLDTEEKRAQIARELEQLRQRRAEQPVAGVDVGVPESLRLDATRTPADLQTGPDGTVDVPGLSETAKNLVQSGEEAREEMSAFEKATLTLAPALSTLTNESRSAANKVLTLASSLVSLIPGAGPVGAVLGTFAGLFQHGGTLGGGEVGIAGESGPEIVRGPAEIEPVEGGAGVIDASRLDPMGQIAVQLALESATLQRLFTEGTRNADRRAG